MARRDRRYEWIKQIKIKGNNSVSGYFWTFASEHLICGRWKYSYTFTTLGNRRRSEFRTRAFEKQSTFGCTLRTVFLHSRRLLRNCSIAPFCCCWSLVLRVLIEASIITSSTKGWQSRAKSFGWYCITLRDKWGRGGGEGRGVAIGRVDWAVASR